MNPNTATFIQRVRKPARFRMFLFSQLPSAYFAGLRLKELDEKHCAVTVPYKWFSKNPFKSTYFACLSMAAEMTTGLLAMAHLYKINPRVSMLVIGMESSYNKKATGLTQFACGDGELFRKAIEETVETGEARVVKAGSVGKNMKGELVAEFNITWSFKAKQAQT